MQCFILPAITAAEKKALYFYTGRNFVTLNVNFDKVSGAANVGHGHLVMVRA